MITKTPKIIYLILLVILVIAADAWRRSWLNSDISVSQAVSPLRKSIRELKQELQETKSLWLEQRAVTAKLDDKISRIDKFILKETEKNLEIADKTENKILDDLVNGIADNSLTSNAKIEEFPDLDQLVSTKIEEPAQRTQQSKPEKPKVVVTPPKPEKRSQPLHQSKPEKPKVVVTPPKPEKRSQPLQQSKPEKSKVVVTPPKPEKRSQPLHQSKPEKPKVVVTSPKPASIKKKEIKLETPKPKESYARKRVQKGIPVVEIKPEDLAPIPPGETKEEIKTKPKLIPPKRVTSVPSRTAVPEVIIPDKDPRLTSKNIDEEPSAEKVDVTTSLSEALLSGHKRGVKMTMSDILEAYEQGSVSNNN